HTVKVGAEDRGGLGKAATRLNRIQDHRRGGKRPQPLQVPRDLPARFVRAHDRARPNRVAERLISRRGLSGLPCDTPRYWFSSTISATAGGRRCVPAAPSASEVCSACRPCTRRPHSRHWPMCTCNRRTYGRTTGNSSWI